MSNIFQAMNPVRGPQGGPGGMMQAFQQFVQQNQGKDPNEMIQQMLSSGRLNQQQLNQVQQMAKQIEGRFSGLRSMFGF